jgi:hypothetical protein
MVSRNASRLLGALAALALGAACGNNGGQGPDTDAHVIPNDGAAPPPFTVTQLQPDHGPVSGGTAVTIRGFGFADGSRVYFGELMVDEEKTVFEGQNRLRILSPPGTVGPVDVKVLRPDGESAVYHDGFTYDVFAVDPPSGSTAGGTFVRVVGAQTDFSATAEVLIDGVPLEDARWVSPTLITGWTPAHAPGLKTVTVEDGDETLSVADAYEYYDSADPINGGLGGGPIDGSVNITVLDLYTDEPVPDAYVLMGAHASSPHQAVTDAAGRVTFSEPGLTGPQMLTVAAQDYERLSIVAFDARDVTVFLTPFVPPTPGTIPGQSWSAVQGYVTFGGVEFGQGCDFDQMMPEPGPEEQRIIKVYQTVGDYDYVAAEPGESGTIREGDECISGYAYSIYARPGSYAVYAVAGIENTSTREFTPYAMGVARNLLSGPDQVIEANITLEHQLAQQINFDLSPAPPLDLEAGPVGYKVRLFIDLGGDGFIIRPDTQLSLTDTSEPVRIEGLPELDRGLAGGQYSALIEAHTNGQYPYSKVYLTALQTGPSPRLVDRWHGIPEAVDPPPGGTPTTSRMTWSASGIEPTFHVVSVKSFPEGDSYWKVYLAGNVNQFVLPDLFGLGPGLDGHPAGPMMWHVISVSVEGMSFDDFSYRYLNDRYWSGTAGNSWQFNFPEP